MSADKGKSKALQEFLSEAQEIVESLGANLMSIDSALKDGEPDPDLINDVFRGMHSLKGLAGTFGVEPLAKLAHHDENLLEEIRLGRVPLDAEMLDRLFGAVDAINYILAMVSEADDTQAADGFPMVEQLINESSSKGRTAEPGEVAPAPTTDPTALFGPEVLEVLTEYEEHRLRTNLERGLPLYRIRTQFELTSIDVDLEAVKTDLKPVGEIITYLPSTESEDPEKLAIDILMALKLDPGDLAAALGDRSAELEQITGDAEEPVELQPPSAEELTPAGGEPENEGGEPRDASAQSIVPAPAGDRAMTVRSVSRSVRVDIGKLDRLMNVVGEMSIVRAAIARLGEDLRAALGERRGLAIELHQIERGFDRRLAELRDGILEVRMVPVGQMFERLARVVRQLSRELGKEVHFIVSGADTEVDKLIIEELSDPLMHIIRNAIDHGIEPRDRRLAYSKPENGTVALTAYQKGNHVLLEVEDDGQGIDGASLLSAAVARGQIDEDQAEAMSSRDVLNLIFLPGISTAEETTEISGRGVGMDVVKTNISALGGVVEVQSDWGIGTKFTITLPVTLAIISVLLVEVAGQTYAVPLNTVAEAVFISSSDVKSVMGTEVTTLHGKTLPLCRLDDFFGTPRPGVIPEGSCVVVAALGQRRLGLVVDSLIGQQEVVIKSLGSSLRGAHWFSGATDIGGQNLALVVDTGAIIERFFTSSEITPSAVGGREDG